jgi:membrane protease YdiL (CAAX protease family)
MKKYLKISTLKVALYSSLPILIFTVFTLITSLVVDDRLMFNTIGLVNMELAFIVTIFFCFKKENIKFLNLRIVNFPTFLLILVASLMFVYIYPAFNSYFYKNILERTLVLTSLQIKNLTSLTVFLHTIILMPLLEEILFRGVFVRLLSRTNNLAVSVLIPSFFFSLYHFNTEQLLSAFIFGIILGLIYYKTNNLTISIFMHSLTNLFLFFSSDFKIKFENFHIIFVILVIFIFAYILNLLIKTNYKDVH